MAGAAASKVYTGYEEMVGMRGRRARAAIDPVGQVFVHGALWRAEPVDGLEGEADPDRR